MVVSLEAVAAVIILDGEGKRLLARYYGAWRAIRDDGPAAGAAPMSSRKGQLAFERRLFERTCKTPSNEVAMCDGHVVLYQCNLDCWLYVVGARSEPNELLLATAMETLSTLLAALVRPQLDKTMLLDAFDVVALAIDEAIDNGIILETDAAAIAKHIGKGMPGAAGSPSPRSLSDISLSDTQSISSAITFARSTLKSFLK